MSINENSRFGMNPVNLDLPRSTFYRNSSHKTTFNAGELIPFYVDEVLPGDTLEIQTSKVIRMPALLTPIMDNIYADFYWFFVPNRLVWEHWRNLMGENTESAWYPTTEYSVPQVVPTSGSGGFPVGSIADYMGIPPQVNGLSVNALPFRAYALICNEWFRNQNVEKPVYTVTGDANATPNASGFNYDAIANSQLVNGGMPYKVYKFKDYFTGCLPAPQKGEPVLMPTGGVGNLPVMALPQIVPDAKAFDSTKAGMLFGTNAKSGSYAVNGYAGLPLFAIDNTTAIGGTNGTNNKFNRNTTPPAFTNAPYPVNLWAINSSAVAPTINDLRTAFQIQKMLERDARGGSRYRELLKSHFGVTSPDARMQIPEYLGGSRVPITINQIVQNSGTTATSPQGTPVGLSQTVDSHFDFKKSFVEHGFVIGVMCVRYDHTYQNGIDRFWSRKSRYEYYWPVFANLGEMGVKNKELFVSGSAEDEEIFGYQEAWADYRYKPSRVSSLMRSGVTNTLDFWHLADDYSELPALSAGYLREDPANINRTLAVSGDVSHQFFMDMYVKNKSTRVMPMYSIPGLIDHH